ncbi:MAG TPA: outer membrane beta-barrel protein [Elusimicrobiales bacterium]|nr:outer membrane beta-barrel protein [Elusimicrobiales bacterium]
MIKFLAALLFCAAAGPARALELSPFYGIEQKRDNNIYLAETGAQSSWINISSAGLSAAHRKDSFTLDASYGIGKISYSKDSSINDYVSHDAALSFGFQPSSGSFLRVREHYLFTAAPETSEQTQRLKHGENTAGADLKMPLGGGFGVFAGAGMLKLSYSDLGAAALNRSDYALRGGLDYELGPDMRAFVSYERGMIRYDSASGCDADYNQPAAGLDGTLLPGIRLYGEVNMQRRDYKQDKTSGGYSANNKPQTYGGRFLLAWQANPDTFVRLSVARGNFESTQTLSRYYVSTRTELDFTQKVQGFIIQAGSGLEFLDSPEVTPATDAKRKTNDFFAGAGLGYELSKACVLGAAFSSRTRSSNESGLGFADQIYNFYLKGRF